MNCPFYGVALHMQYTQYFQPGGTENLMYFRAKEFSLLPAMSNQCGLLIRSHDPCVMQAEGKTPDWQTCPIVSATRPL
jgi:hypothetical protein